VKRKMIAVALLSVLNCFAPAMAQSDNTKDRAKNVSLIRLIANPKAFDGRRLRLAGYLGHNGLDRSVGLYVTELDGQNSIISNSVDLHLEELTVDKLIGKYVILEGTYHSPVGPLSDYINGYLDHVSRPEVLMRGDVPK
jgi:hypothetical protein